MHLLSEVINNEKRIASKVESVAKRVRRAGKKVYTYQQTIGSNTRLTIYMYRISKTGLNYIVGCWYHSPKGLCWVSVGENQVNFYISHFFHRYAERFLKKDISVFESALEFYSQYEANDIRQIKKRDNDLYEIQTPLHGGLGLGVSDETNCIVIYNTCITEEMLREDQVRNIEDDKELDDALESLYPMMIDSLTERVAKLKEQKEHPYFPYLTTEGIFNGKVL